MNLANLALDELVILAEADPRFQVDPLFTELAVRARMRVDHPWPQGSTPRQAQLIDARRQV